MLAPVIVLGATMREAEFFVQRISGLNWRLYSYSNPSVLQLLQGLGEGTIFLVIAGSSPVPDELMGFLRSFSITSVYFVRDGR